MMVSGTQSFSLSVAMRFFFFLTVIFGMGLPPITASAMIEPVSVATDPRIKTITYGPDMVYKYTGYLRYQTSIELGQGETISTITMGDPTGWKINPAGSKIFVKPTDLDITTNMMLITNKRTYLFEMHAEEVKDISDPRLTFILRFVYPDDADGSVVNTGMSGNDNVPDLETEDLSKFNFRYSITGSQDISPIRIFDDGEFTFFEFRNINADLPAIFQVDNEGNENLINFRMRGHYMVVERVSGRYTLRHGNMVVCVFNEAWGDHGGHQKKGWFGSGSSSSDKAPLPSSTVK